MQELKWYAIRVYANQEKKVKDYIHHTILTENYEKWVDELLVPTEKSFNLKKGKKIVREKITFPGYVLIKANLTPDMIKAIRRTKGVLSFTGDRSGKPIALKQTEVDNIIGRIAEKDTVIPFIVGETVKIIDGVFNNFNGVVESVQDEKQKVRVIVQIFGRKTPVDVQYHQIEKTS